MDSQLLHHKSAVPVSILATIFRRRLLLSGIEMNIYHSVAFSETVQLGGLTSSLTQVECV